MKLPLNDPSNVVAVVSSSVLKSPVIEFVIMEPSLFITKPSKESVVHTSSPLDGAQMLLLSQISNCKLFMTPLAISISKPPVISIFDDAKAVVAR